MDVMGLWRLRLRLRQRKTVQLKRALSREPVVKPMILPLVLFWLAWGRHWLRARERMEGIRGPAGGAQLTTITVSHPFTRRVTAIGAKAQTGERVSNMGTNRKRDKRMEGQELG